MPEVGKEFPILNGIGLMSGASSTSAPSGSQSNTLERSGIMSSGVVPSQQHQQAPGGIATQQVQLSQQQQQQAQQGQVPQPLTLLSQQSETKEKGNETEPTQLTAIFRPDDEWKEKLRLSHEASEQARLDRAGQHLGQLSGAASWEHRGRDDEEEPKEEEADVEEEEANEVGEGDGAKVWKPKRTLRKSVASPS